MKRQSFLFIVVAVLFSLPAQADFVAAVCRGPTAGPVKVRGSDNQRCSGFVTLSPDGGSREVSFASMSGVLLSSSDGRSVVMIESYLEGFVVDGRVRAFRSGRADQDAGWGEFNPIVVRVFRDGREVAAHRIHGLIGEHPKLSESISHVKWLAEDPTSMPKEGPLKLRLLDGTTREVPLNPH